MRRMRNIAALVAMITAACVSVALAAGTASTTPPSVSTGSATNATETTATLNGAVNPNGTATDYAFQWGPTNGYGHETSLASAGAGTAWESVSASLSALTPGTTYHFRIIAINGAGDTVVGNDQTLTTTGTAPGPSAAPTASTKPASSVTQSTATVNGTVNPAGQNTTYYFEYGPTANYGLETGAAGAGSGTADEQVSANLSALTPGTTYHFRVVAVSAGGTTLGTDQTFTTTAQPVVTTGTASAVGQNGATLNGTVNPDGKATTYYFQFGKSNTYGTNTPTQNAGSGTTDVAVHAGIGGLTANTTYHYRLVATNSDGTTYGNDVTFQTQGSSVTPPPSASQVRVMGRMGFVSPGRIIGVEVGCFGGSTTCSGHIAMSHNGTLIGQRDFSIAPDSGGFQNLQISSTGWNALKQNHVFHLLPVTINITTSSGQHLTYTMHLARWVWH